MVFALGRGCAAPIPDPATPAVEFLRTRVGPAAPLTLSRRPLRGREDVVLVMCSFC